jgi:hypothetical protein
MVAMIKLNNLHKDMIEVLIVDSESVFGGDAFLPNGSLNIQGTVQNGRSDAGFNVGVPGSATSFYGNSNGGFGFDSNLSPNTKVTGDFNSNPGQFRGDVGIAQNVGNATIGIRGGSNGVSLGGLFRF